MKAPPKRLIAEDLPARNLGSRLPFPNQAEPHLKELGFSPANIDALSRDADLVIIPLLVPVVRLQHFFHSNVSLCGHTQSGQSPVPRRKWEWTFLQPPLCKGQPGPLQQRIRYGLSGSRGHRAASAFVAWIVGVVMRRIVVARIAERAGSNALFQFFDI